MNRPFVAGRFSRHSRVNIDQISPKEEVKEGEEEAEEESSKKIRGKKRSNWWETV